MWKQLLALLLALYACPLGPGDEGGEGGEGGGDDGEGGGDGAGDEGAGDDPNQGEDGEGAGNEGEGDDTRVANMKALRQRAQAEREARIAAEARLQALEAQNREMAARANGGSAPKEQELPADADEMQRFVHQSNKVLRANTEKTNQATFLALDAADKVEFYSEAADNPLIGKYKARVEAELQRMIREEKNRAPRKLIMRYLIGLDGENAAIAKAKVPGKKSKEQADAEERTRAARSGGNPPRSDVKGKERQSDRQKRLDRLGNNPI